MPETTSTKPRIGLAIVLLAVGGISIGVGIAIGAAYVWRQRHVQRPWDPTKITARFLSANEWDDSGENKSARPSGSFVLSFVLENPSDEDYELREADNPRIMVRHGADYFTAPEASLTLPLFIPARHRVVADLTIPFTENPLESLAAMRRGTSEHPINGLIPESSALLRIKLEDASGFSVFDSLHRYRIDLPRAW